VTNIKPVVFFVTTIYPPSKGGGAFTRYQQVQHLLENGFKVCVLTKSKSLQSDLGFSQAIIGLRYTFIARLLAKIRVIPDVSFFWAKAVADYILSNAKKGDVVFVTTGGELSLALIGYYLKKKNFTEKIILNLHDFPDHSVYLDSSPLKKRGALYQYLECKAFSNVDLILCNSRKMIALINQKYPKLISPKDYFYFGFEGCINPQKKINANKEGLINIVSIGTMGFLQSPDFLINVVAENPYFFEKFKIFFIGSKEGDKKYPTDLIEYLGYMNRESLAYYAQNHADIALLSLIDKPIFMSAMPTKFYEYVNLGIPILATVPMECEVGDLIQKYGIGWVVRHGDIQSLKSVLLRLISNPQEIIEAREKILEHRQIFDRKITQKRMVTSINNLLGESV
jgi:glycosyltransferase involved in cell wall biosynthesis